MVTRNLDFGPSGKLLGTSRMGARAIDPPRLNDPRTTLSPVKRPVMPRSALRSTKQRE